VRLNGTRMFFLRPTGYEVQSTEYWMLTVVMVTKRGVDHMVA